jgi:arsenate reductase
MAEAIAQSLGQAKFIFSSAGVDPGAIDPRTLAFLKDKGLDTSRLAPKAVYQVPNLDHYQVIVGVAREAPEAFPRSPRKLVFVDWSIDDPSRAQGSPEEVAAAYEATYRFLSNHVRDLVGAVLGIRIE